MYMCRFPPEIFVSYCCTITLWYSLEIINLSIIVTTLLKLGGMHTKIGNAVFYCSSEKIHQNNFHELFHQTTLLKFGAVMSCLK